MHALVSVPGQGQRSSTVDPRSGCKGGWWWLEKRFRAVAGGCEGDCMASYGTSEDDGRIVAGRGGGAGARCPLLPSAKHCSVPQGHMKARRNQKREILSDIAMGAFHCDKSCTPPCLFHGAKLRKHGVAVLGPACVTARHVPRNVVDMCQLDPSKHDNTKSFSSCAQLRYHPIACILIDRHQIEPPAHLAPHLEALKNQPGTNSLLVYRWYVTRSPAVKRSLFMTTKRCPTGRHTPQYTRAHGITATPTL